MGQTSNAYGHSRPSSDSVSAAVPSSLRASSSLAKLDLYIPPYEKSHNSAVDQIASEFSEMGISHHRGRESLPVGPLHFFLAHTQLATAGPTKLYWFAE
jgi:hypothetical protein